MKVSENFELHEFIDPVTYAELGEKSIEKVDPKLFGISELLRSKTGRPGIINNWKSGGPYKESGLRRKDTPTGAKKSAHKDGLAIDYKTLGMAATLVYQLILDNEAEFYDAGVRQIEDISFTPTWVHLSTRGKDNAGKKIQIIKP